MDFVRVTRPLTVRSRYREKLFGVGARSFTELAREACQPALVLHVQQQLRGAVGVRGDNHLLSGGPVLVEVAGTLGPTWVTRMHLEPAPIARNKVIHLV